MKKLSKIVALLLAGALTMLLFTACGGGGGSPTEEQKVLAQISREKGVQVTNDAELRAVAERNLNDDRKDLDAKFKFLGYAGAVNFHTEPLGDDLVITITARYNYTDTHLSYVLKRISEYVDTDHKVTVNQNGDWSNIGVVVQSNNEQSYIGISVRIKNIYK